MYCFMRKKVGFTRKAKRFARKAKSFTRKTLSHLTLSGPGYLMSLKVRGRGGTCAPPLISKSTNSILMTLYATLFKNCSHYRSAVCFKIGLRLAEIIRCLCTKVVFL